MLAPVFRDAKIAGAHAHRFRHTLATDILAKGGTMADHADVLGISEHIARRHYAKWSAARQKRISTIMRQVHAGETFVGNGLTVGGQSAAIQ
jgi:integrase